MLKAEPGSHTARLLSEWCACAAAQQAPLSDEAVLDCYEAARAKAEQHLPKPPKAGDEEDDDLDAALVRMFAVSELLKDPLLWKIQDEALHGRGPRALELARLTEAALASDDAHALFIGWVLADDSNLVAKLEQRLERARYADTLSALLFLGEYYDQERAYQEQGAEFKAALAALRCQQPDEGLWLVLNIPFAPPADGDATVPYPPLTEVELELLERGVAAPRFTDHRRAALRAATCLLQCINYPAAEAAGERLAMLVPGPFSALGNVNRRGRALAAQRFAAGDSAGGVAVARALCRLADRIEPRTGNPGFARLVASSHRKLAADVVVAHLPSSRTQVWLEFQRVRLESVATQARLSAIDIDTVPLSLPVAALADAERRLSDGDWSDWKLRRLNRKAQASAREDHNYWLRYALEEDRQPEVESLLKPGILQLRKLLPDLRPFRDRPLDDERLWALIWTLGELRDAQSAEWLTTLRNDDRPWVRITAAEALRKLAGHNHVEGSGAPHAAPEQAVP